MTRRTHATGPVTAGPADGLTFSAFGPIMVDVRRGVRTAFYPQASGTAYKANHAKNLLYGDNDLGAVAYSHSLPSDKRFFRFLKMTGLSRGEPAQALTI